MYKLFRDSIDTMIAFFFAFLLKGITYGIGNFSFSNTPLFSKSFFCDAGILLVFYLISLAIIHKIRDKRDDKKNERNKL
jgi:hypothetical protein